MVRRERVQFQLPRLTGSVHRLVYIVFLFNYLLNRLGKYFRARAGILVHHVQCSMQSLNQQIIKIKWISDFFSLKMTIWAVFFYYNWLISKHSIAEICHQVIRKYQSIAIQFYRIPIYFISQE